MSPKARKIPSRTTVPAWPTVGDLLALRVDLSVPLAEMREWSSARTEAYFGGIARALAAIDGARQDRQ